MSSYIIPLFICIIIFACIKNRVPVYDTVVAGAEEGLMMVGRIIPTMVVILTAVSMLRASGALEAAEGILHPLLDKVGVPPEIVPMVLLRPVSGSGAFGILADNLSAYGADSRIGRLTSVIMGSTETTFYTIAVYFGATDIKDIKRAIPCAVIGDLVCVVLACILIK